MVAEAEFPRSAAIERLRVMAKAILRIGVRHGVDRQPDAVLHSDSSHQSYRPARDSNGRITNSCARLTAIRSAVLMPKLVNTSPGPRFDLG